jgi:molybdopterin-guanine dinucleotide biosynthesis protein B
MSKHRVIGVAGFKNAGKTTLVERLVTELTDRGFGCPRSSMPIIHSISTTRAATVSVISKAGASQVAVVSGARWAVVSELRGEPEPSLEHVLATLEPCDLVIVEGYKRDSHDKIEVRNVADNKPCLYNEDETIVAVAANGPVEDCPVPVYSRDDIHALADFICGRMKLVEVPSLI